MADSELEFFESLPRSRGAACALLRTEDERVLLVKPTYKPGWSLPGGVIEQRESPLAACRRECAEEIGFVPRLDGLACVDWIPPDLSPDGRPATIFVFSGRLPAERFGEVRLPADELSDAVLADTADFGLLLPGGRGRRCAAALKAAASGLTVYLQDGRPVDWGG
ncbi:ADP-ribose pyrophosphatase YjhB (NUDIX family) [Nocardiopsis mwathae]|uniref:ADP-ribose pyrophosphatase YjhB (NUDIX family) n=1 Tax=Nocardiopsis mwathae TaxID=1472723 RepID=A0A7W9YGP9_9ACTN|nr:NUDIX hydrolase [Nocardiopsis mwathae]MBB6171802.1 ADP-ribose pyrophosphatase YjhB (NUDIX family) [Nocardiopsis mwathae]